MNINKYNKIIKSFIISAGRTGTEFFGKRLGDLSPSQIVSIHQPDVVNFKYFRRKELFEKIKRIGLFDLFILKALGIKGSRNLSLKKLNNKIKDEKVVNYLVKERKNFIDSPETKVYIEANWQLFGVIESIFKIKNSKIIIIFRDPRKWVQSWMNKGGWYDDNDLLENINILGFKRITPKNVGINNLKWKHYTQFQKLCWVWDYMNTNFFYALNNYPDNLIRHYFFEDIFIRKKESIIKDFLQFSLEKYFKEDYVSQLKKMLKKKVNQNINKEFSDWQEWDKSYCIDLHDFCGDLMHKLGYGNESEWLEKIK